MLNRTTLAVVAGTLSLAAVARAQDVEAPVRAVKAHEFAQRRMLRQESHRVVETVKQHDRQRTIARIREVEAQTKRFLAERSASHGFSVILALGERQGGAPARDLPPAASKALADMSQLLPYKSYELLDARWIRGSPRSTAQIRGPENRAYELELRTSPRPDNEVQIEFHLRDPSRAFPVSAARVGRRNGAANSAVRLGKRPGRVIDTSFNMDVGETVVVGTSRLQGEKALIVLLTAVGK